MKNQIIPVENIQNRIFTINGIQVILDRDLAKLYQTDTRTLKQAVKRNIDRFPADFLIELTDPDIDSMVSQFVIPSKSYFGGAKPFAFTEQGVAMLSAVLRTQYHNTQYDLIEVKQMDAAHDRFLITDNTTLYHLGASLKHKGKKWFAFSKMNTETAELLNLLKIKINE